MTRPVLHVALLAAAIGGALGAVARWGLTEVWSVTPSGFPWAVFVINVAGCALLATVPLMAAVRRSSWLPVFIGTGLLGGFTTMSTASEQTFTLLDDGRTLTALSYAGGTLVASLLVVQLIGRLNSPADRAPVEAVEAVE